jgi:phosphotriesterase-related protein
MPNDGQRVATIGWLRDRGNLGQVLMAHDIDRKSLWRRYGGPGLAHLLEDVVPVMQRRGFDDGDLQTLFVDNPARMLTFA